MVSRFKLRPEIWSRIFDLFSESLVSIKNKNKLDIFLSDFLSPTEKIMLAKRFAVAVLLAKGNSYEEIKRILRVTTATIAKMNLHIKYGEKGMNEVVENVLKRDSARIIWEEIQSMFDVPIKGLPLSEYHKKVLERNKTINRLKNEI
ncbi:MAG: TrpR-like protein [Microgenomates group bacterium GW2011_GWC1_39_7b]|uniref:TrpR family protein YerC/YecD n=3 Tax=Candidatus Woeseibacteriota TaxID=1752722 RepID=A0A0G0UV31_9BACT|nr:MAG: TrpR family protein YerC/YecD [Candidatus Woesebacteria bacterium GW2011_GWB1_39_10]KKR26262.1 MAG: TrpR-like protein [Microgenomates group bacterium GW2011_GWC1_39_7b]KKR74061.1 MAG: TrpR family protein YerC/YecD [Candidatus Woesebacteria bacterium GW2011_GWA2_40_7]KKR92548.1 MAG: TrpR family protein YerC/YecD [Candidatus Woesebacteria bacterium GW2011_GWA1_41_13b]